ncbi:hypothetical protein GIB67_039176 [Kingdonia uniflora]|uniref:Uncharacterized protein n=1 Tax=Kingdonia uniflora TaxID=39325 RepID=A0A7J7MLP3_9MAGN|nr:hypothetical protein GIB67_039176 [Kingdonia uniflora]
MSFHKLSDETIFVDDSVFGFFGRSESEESFSNSRMIENEEDEDEDVDESKCFWEAQFQLLHATLTKSSSMESTIRRATKTALSATICVCQIPISGGCKDCLLKHVCDYLKNAGFNTAICKSKWRSSPDIPSGEHKYIDVMDTSSCKKGEVRVVIELNLRQEFQMGRASKEYNELIKRLPEIFVGKAERLKNLIKIICSSAKKCMKENKMHMGPWRKQTYMHAKWFGTYERTILVPAVFSLAVSAFSDQRSKLPKSSMLTFDLLHNFPSLHCTAVQVL